MTHNYKVIVSGVAEPMYFHMADDALERSHKAWLQDRQKPDFFIGTDRKGRERTVNFNQVVEIMQLVETKFF